jgi:hypothetical protein
MTDLRDAARQALEALEAGADSWRLIGPAIGALKAALEQPYAEQAHRVEQETHGRMRIDPVTGNVSIGTPTEQPERCACGDRPKGKCPGEWEPGCDLGNNPAFARRVALEQPEQEPLSDEELDRLWREPMSADWEHREYGRAIEAAHGIKENT